jgi:eukaryotic-like serine/threonine-protein kinase
VGDLREQLQSGLDERYRLERELGRGGMATVFLAHDLRHKRPVALKVLHPELAHTLGPERFQREIETVARLQHPHILTVHDSGATAGQLWFTMPFVEGESLRHRLRREPQLPVEVALRVTTEAARALQYAHDHGVIHRDIKPENLLLTKDGSTLVADFGIARALSGSDDRLTETGMSVGTPTYMSPEQSVGDRHLDARTDVYSLGAVLYEMLAGEPPYTGVTAQTVMAKRLSGEVPRVRQLRPSVPASVERAVTRALAPVAADRFPSADEFARALQATTAEPSVTSSHGAAASGARGRGQIPVAITALVLGVVISAGVLFAWRRSHAGPVDPPDAKVLAVLPFENLGDSADAYLAEGIAGELRGRLSQVPGLAVVGRASSNAYRGTAKPPRQIAQELGAEYLLTGTVQWARASQGPGRIRVSPELVRVEPGAVPTTRWQREFDAVITDVLAVQADIASRVASALDLALGDSTRRQLAAKATANQRAYDAFLQGEAALQTTCRVCTMVALDPASLRRAIASYSEAVALDSAFGSAWARLAYAQATIYQLSVPTPAMARAAERALARAQSLEAGAPPTQMALSVYWQNVRHEPGKALAAAEAGLARAPNDPDLLVQAAFQDLLLGRTGAGVDRLARAQALDPRSPSAAANLARALLWLRRWPEAALAAQKGLALAPTDVTLVLLRIESVLGRGDLAGARQIIAQAGTRRVEPSMLGAYLASYDDLYWVLNDAQQRLVLTLPLSAFDGDTAAWGLVRAELYHLRGDPTHSRVYADSARRAFATRVRRTPGDAESRCLFGLALAYKGLKTAAIREGERGVALEPISHNGVTGPYCQHQLARIYLLVGEPERALDQLEPLLKIPYTLSPGWLKIDPNFASLRGNPRFERLVNGM